MANPFRLVLTPAQDLLVYERDRVLEYSANLEYVRETRLQTPVPAAVRMTSVVPGGLDVFVRVAGALDSIYFFRVRSVAPDPTEVKPSDPSVSERILATREIHADGSFWLIHSLDASGYEAIKVDTLGKTSLVFTYRPTWWFTRSARPAPVVSGNPAGAGRVADTMPRPGSRVVHALERPDRALLTLILHSKPEWRAVPRVGRFAGSTYASVVDVADPTRMVHVGSMEVAGFPVTLLPGSRLVTYREDSAGVPYLDIWQIQINNGGTTG